MQQNNNTMNVQDIVYWIMTFQYFSGIYILVAGQQLLCTTPIGAVYDLVQFSYTDTDNVVPI